MNKPQKSGTKRSEKFGPYWTWLFPSVALFIKVITISNIPGHIWPGSDAESYLDAVNGLVKSGLFSEAEKLQYFPAGYPVVIWLLAKISISNALLFLGIFQSLVFAFASWFFVKKLNLGKFSRLAPWVAFLVSFNPTLALSSLAIGYESLVASLLMISLALLFQENKEKLLLRILIFSISSASICGSSSTAYSGYSEFSFLLLNILISDPSRPIFFNCLAMSFVLKKPKRLL